MSSSIDEKDRVELKCELEQKESVEEKEALEHQPEQPDLGEQYEILSELGRGGMGVVYLVRDTRLDTNFAIKVLDERLANDKAALKRFEQEAESAADLNHENLVSVYGHGKTASGAPYIVMDFLDGAPLSKVLKDEGALKPERAISIFRQILNALAHAHESGVMHRDIKPTNIIITDLKKENEAAHIVDFGIAKVTPTANRETHDLTRTGEIFGSPHYMSPEQCLGFMLDNRSDIYSFGCLMHEVLTGAPPFEGANPIQLVVKHINEEPEGFQQKLKADRTLRRLEGVVLKCLEKDKSSRYQSVDEIMQDLDAIRAGNDPAPYVRQKVARPTFTKRHILGFLVAFAGLAIYGTILSELASMHVFPTIASFVAAFVLGSGIYVCLTSALDRHAQTKKSKGERDVWFIAMTSAMGLACLTLFPFSLMTLLNFHIGYSFSTLCALAILAHILLVLVAVVCGFCWLVFRSPGRRHVLRHLSQFTIMGSAMVAVLYFGCPTQTGKVITEFARSTVIMMPELSRALYESAAFLDHDSTDGLATLAILDEKDGRYSDEIAHLQRAIKRIEKNPSQRSRVADYYFRIAKAYGMLGQGGKQLETIDTVIEKGLNPPLAWEKRLEFLMHHRDYDDALLQVTGARNSNYPVSVNCLRMAAEVCCIKGQYSDAIDFLTDAIKKDDYKAGHYLARGLVQEHVGNITQAREDYKKAIELAQLNSPEAALTRLVASARLGIKPEFQNAFNYLNTVDMDAIAGFLRLGPLSRPSLSSMVIDTTSKPGGK